MSTETKQVAAVPARDVPAAGAMPKAGVRFSGSAKAGHTVNMEREEALGEIFGTDDLHQANDLLSHCLKVLKGSEAGDSTDTEDERHFMVSVVKDLAPRDAVERMLAVQMAATHVAMIRAGRSMATCDLLAQLEAHSSNYNKLGRTFTAQVEALRKHRTGGKQTVVVQHVTVADGGQAIVGHVETGGRARGEGHR